MYYPKQIPYLLNKKFQENIEYKEYNIKELENYCMCIWQMKSKRILDETIYNNILPDACIDLVIDFTNKSICFAGFSKETIAFELHKKVDYMGIRLKPGAFYTIFGTDANKIMDNQIMFSKIDNSNNIDEIIDIKDTNKRLNILRQYLLEKIKHNPNRDFINIVEKLYESPKEQTVMNIAKSFGYNRRHLFRIFKTNYGVSTKVLLNILRLHLCLTLILEDDMDLIDIASLCGFYDQSHFIKEIKRYTGISPLQLIENYR